MSAAFDLAALLRNVSAATKPEGAATIATSLQTGETPMFSDSSEKHGVATELLQFATNEPLADDWRGTVASCSNSVASGLLQESPADWAFRGICSDVEEVARGDAGAASQSPESFDLRWWDNSDEAVAERAALCAGTCPAIYLDAWAGLNCQKPMSAPHDDWQTAINDAGLFLDSWGHEAAELCWPPETIFDAPRPGKSSGLIWRLRGSRVAAFGANYARLSNGRVIERRKLP